MKNAFLRRDRQALTIALTTQQMMTEYDELMQVEGQLYERHQQIVATGKSMREIRGVLHPGWLANLIVSRQCNPGILLEPQ
jgi:hypothetical protein